ncbi:hypothetical protein R6Q59_027160 [Mikania micrantha]
MVLRGTDPVETQGHTVGPVAQRIRARGYEPRCRVFKSLLAHNRPKREGPFPLGGFGISADPEITKNSGD